MEVAAWFLLAAYNKMWERRQIEEWIVRWKEAALDLENFQSTEIVCLGYRAKRVARQTCNFNLLTSAESRNRDVVMRNNLWRTLFVQWHGPSWTEYRWSCFENSMQIKTIQAWTGMDWERIITLREELQIRRPGPMGTPWVKKAGLPPGGFYRG